MLRQFIHCSLFRSKKRQYFFLTAIALLVLSVTLLALWPVTLYRKKNAAEKFFANRPDEPAKREAIVTDLLQKMYQSYRYPIVLLVMRNHPQLYYTGKSYLTSNDVTLFEAVFLPR